ncbi:hypothetical protein Baya_5273 [Bagarius yarrelli]|uniref:Uncharacterized protein n=1 Tax=Bagarius yarrelli TaxID=175774 RepID=A0A556TWE3_BAGYA|nr:hypothetical protein Baya_5273 [Bagarius yarrelli]
MFPYAIFSPLWEEMSCTLVGHEVDFQMWNTESVQIFQTPAEYVHFNNEVTADQAPGFPELLSVDEWPYRPLKIHGLQVLMPPAEDKRFKPEFSKMSMTGSPRDFPTHSQAMPMDSMLSWGLIFASIRQGDQVKLLEALSTTAIAQT